MTNEASWTCSETVGTPNKVYSALSIYWRGCRKNGGVSCQSAKLNHKERREEGLRDST